MNWKEILKNEIADITEGGQDKLNQWEGDFQFENPEEIDSLIRLKQKGSGIYRFMLQSHLGKNKEINLLEEWDKIITKIKQLYAKYDLTDSAYTKGIIRQSTNGVDNTALNMLANLDKGKGHEEAKEITNYIVRR
tara:strand:+ start:689 stop:1093 length:405 start_codon:yes stop_codon:yes gene_type:complete